MPILILIRASFVRQRSLYILWVLSLCAAVTGLVMVDVYRNSLSETLRGQGRKILGGDLSVSIRRVLSASELETLHKTLPPSARYAQLTEMFAMVSTKSESRLAMLRFISDEFPLVGDLEITPGNLAEANAPKLAHGQEINARPEVWVARDVLTLLHCEVGGSLKIGEITATIVGVVRKDSSQTFRFGNLAPRIYMHRNFLTPSHLVQFGSTFTDTALATLGAADPAPDAVKALKSTLENQFKDPGVHVTVPTDLEQGSLQVLSRLLDFLGLVGLVTLSLGWIGVYYLGRRWLALESPSSAVLKCIGVSSSQLRRLLLIKMLIVLTVGAVLGGAVAWIAAQALTPMVRESMPADFILSWSWRNSLLLLILGPMAGLLLLFWPISSLAFEKPMSLFQERSENKISLLGLSIVLICATFLFVALTFLQARSWQVTGAFLGSLAGSVVVVAGLGYGFLKLIARLRKSPWADRTNISLKLVMALWSRRVGTSLLLITVSALASLLSQLLPHMQKTLVSELNSEGGQPRPALFMVDIQDEQLEPLKIFLHQHGLTDGTASPFIRARILKVNDTDYERAEVKSWSTREEETDARFRNRGVNLSYRSQLTEFETIIEGKSWKDHRTEPPEVSVEEGYAKRMHLRIGDRIRFDVQGIEIDTHIASIRKINWESFSPNFFIQFPDGVLNLAPKTWVMSVPSNPKMSAVEIQTLVTKQFSNITSINVHEALANATLLLNQLSSGMRMASRLALGLGLLVFLLILNFQVLSARKDWQQLRLLGMTTRQVWWLQTICYGGLCGLGTIIGAILSVGVAWGIFHFGFDSAAQFDTWTMLQIWAVTWSAAILGLTALGYREHIQSRGRLALA